MRRDHRVHEPSGFDRERDPDSLDLASLLPLREDLRSENRKKRGENRDQPRREALPVIEPVDKHRPKRRHAALTPPAAATRAWRARPPAGRAGRPARRTPGVKAVAIASTCPTPPGAESPDPAPISRSAGLIDSWRKSLSYNGIIRARSNSAPARPYMARLRVFSLLICPSVCPLLQGSDIAFRTASRSWRIVFAKRCIA